MAFGAKIKLSVNNSPNQAKFFRDQIQTFVDAATAKNPIQIHNVQLHVTQREAQVLARDLQRSINDRINASGGLTVKVGTLDATAAITKLREQINVALSGSGVGIGGGSGGGGGKGGGSAGSSIATAVAIRSTLNKAYALQRNSPRYRSIDNTGQIPYIIQSLEGQVKNGSITATRDNLKEYNNTIAQTAILTRQANKEGTTFAQDVGNIYKRYGAYALVSRSITMIIKLTTDMIGATTKLNTELTELSKITNMNDVAMSRFLDNAAVRANRLSTSMSDVITATADFTRLGYSVDQASEMADAALVYKNVGYGINDITTASESIISTMKAFEKEGLTAMDIVDKFNEVGNNFAISQQGIGDVLKRSAAALSAAGNTLDETIALAVGANDVLQNPEKVGTVLSTASMYMRAAKVDAEDAGIAIDGMAASVSKLREDLKKATHNQVDIMQDANTFKSTIQIYRELAEVYDTLEDVDQAAILNLIGGKRNATANASILQNWKDVEAALVASQTAAGSAEAANAKYADSIQGKMAKLSGSFQNMSNLMINSDMIKFFVDMGIAITNVMSKWDGLAGRIIAVTTLLITLTKVLERFKTFTVLSPILASLTVALKNISPLSSGESSLTEVGKTISTTFKTTLGQVSQLQFSLAHVAATIAAIALIVKAIDWWNGRDYKQAMEELEQAKENITNQTKELDSLNDLQDKLAAAKGDKQALSNIQKDLNEAIGKTPGLINGEADAYEKATTKLQAHTQAIQNQVDLFEQAKRDAARSGYDTKDLEQFGINANRQTMSIFLQTIEQMRLKGLTDDEIAKSGFMQHMGVTPEDMTKIKQYAVEAADLAAQAFDKEISEYEGAGGQAFIKNLITQAAKSGYTSGEIESMLDTVFAQSDILLKESDEYTQSLVDNSKDSEEELSDVSDILDKLKERFPLLTVAIDAFYDELLQQKDVEQTGEDIETVSKQIENLKTKLTDIQSAYQTLSGAIEEYSTQGYLSVDTFEKLMEIQPELLNQFVDENGQLVTNTEALNTYTEALIDQMAVKQMTAIVDYVAGLGEEERAAYLAGAATDSYTTSLEAMIGAAIAGKAALQGLSGEQMQQLATLMSVPFRLAQMTKNGLKKGGLNKSGSKSSSTNAENTRKAQADLAKKERDFAKKMDDEQKKDHLERLKDSLNAQKDLLERYKKNLEIIDFGLDIASDNDFESRSDFLAQKFDTLTQYGRAMREEFERVYAIIPQTGDEAQELANRLQELGNDMRSNVSTLRETYVAIQQLRVNALSTITTNNLDAFKREFDNLQRRIDILKSDNPDDFKYTQEILDMKALLPIRSDFDKARSQKQRQDRQLIADEQATQDKINEVITNALQKQAEENAKARADERAKLIADMEETRREAKAKVDKAVSDYGTQLDTAVEMTDTTVSQITDILSQEFKMGKVDDSEFRKSVDEAVEYVKNKLSTTAGYTNGFPNVLGTGTTTNTKSIPIGASIYMKSNTKNGQMYGHVGLWDGQYIISSESGKITRKTWDQMFSSGTYKYEDWGWQGGKKLSAEQGQQIAATARKYVGAYKKEWDGYCQRFVAQAFAEAMHQVASKDGSAKNASQMYGNRNKHYATGTDYHPGGLAVVGDEGRGKYEAVILPNGEVQIMGQNGAELVNLPRGTSVLSHSETKATLKNAPHYAEGTSNPVEETIAGIKKVLEPIEDVLKDARDERLSIKSVFDKIRKADPDNIDYINNLEAKALLKVFKAIDPEAAKYSARAYKETLDNYLAFRDEVEKDPSKFSQEIEDAFLETLDDIESKAYDFEAQLSDIQQGLYEEMESRINEINDYIEDRNLYTDWFDFKDTELGAIRRKIDIVNNALAEGTLLQKQYNELIRDLEREAFEVGKRDFIAAMQREVDKKIKKLEQDKDNYSFESSQYNARQSLLQDHFNTLNNIREEQHNINKELDASLTMYEYLNEDTRKLLFNQEDYDKLSSKLTEIERRALRLQKNYENDITSATKENIDEITSAYHMRYEAMMKEYEIQKASLEVVKKRQQLDNVLAERNVRMFINGQWQWVANTQDVINARNELHDAEYGVSQAQTSASQTNQLNRLQSAQDHLTTTINEIDKQIQDTQDDWTQMQENLNGEAYTVSAILEGIARSDSPLLQNIIRQAGQAIADFVEELSGVALQVPTPYVSSIDYSDLMKNVPKGSALWNALNKERNAKIDDMGLHYKKFASGTANAPRGLAQLGEDGAESIITKFGRFIPINSTSFAKMAGGEMVFNKEQLQNLSTLWQASKLGGLVSLLQGKISGLGGTSNIDNSITINGMRVDSGSAEGQALVSALRRYVAVH